MRYADESDLADHKGLGAVSRIVAAGAGASAGLVGGEAGLILAAVGTKAVVEATGAVWEFVSERRRQRAAVPLASAALNLNRSVAELVDLLLDDERLLQLFSVITRAALNTALDAKLQALGRVLANAIADEAKLDLDYMVADALEVIEPPHLKVLAHLSTFWNGEASQAMNVYALHDQLPELGLGLRLILAALQAKSLVSEHVEYGDPGRAPRLGNQAAASLPLNSVAELRRLWLITEFGRDVLGRIQEFAPDPTPPVSDPDQ